MESHNQALQEAAQDLDLVRRQLAAMGIVLAAACAVIGDQLQARHNAAKAAKRRRRTKR